MADPKCVDADAASKLRIRLEGGSRFDLVEYLGTGPELLAAGVVEAQMLEVKHYGELSGRDSFGDKYFTIRRRDGRFKVRRWMGEQDHTPWYLQRNAAPRRAAADATVREICERFRRAAP